MQRLNELAEMFSSVPGPYYVWYNDEGEEAHWELHTCLDSSKRDRVNEALREMVDVEAVLAFEVLNKQEVWYMFLWADSDSSHRVPDSQHTQEFVSLFRQEVAKAVSSC